MNIEETNEFIKNLTEEEEEYLKQELWYEFLKDRNCYYFEIEIDEFLTNTIKKFKQEDKMKYYEMDHRGGLEEALKTKRPITQTEFNHRLKDYKFYCFDTRIKCFRYILNDIENNQDKPVWLLEEVDNKWNSQ